MVNMEIINRNEKKNRLFDIIEFDKSDKIMKVIFVFECIDFFLNDNSKKIFGNIIYRNQTMRKIKRKVKINLNQKKKKLFF